MKLITANVLQFAEYTKPQRLGINMYYGLSSAFISSFIFILRSFFFFFVVYPLGMEKTMQDYEDWTTEPIPDSLDKAYKKALNKLEKCLPFEDTLVSMEVLCYTFL